MNYERLETHTPYQCFYCGQKTTGRDHVLPVAFHRLARFYRKAMVTVPCCTSCNSLAGDAVFRTVAEKQRFIKVRIRAYYRRLLDCDQWSVDEINELGPSLQTYLLGQEALRQVVLDRLAWKRR